MLKPTSFRLAPDTLARSPMRADEVMATIPHEGHGTGKTHAPTGPSIGLSDFIGHSKSKNPRRVAPAGVMLLIL